VALRDKDRITLGYAAAIALSALGHAVFLYLALFALPRWLKADQTPPPAYTVAIVDNLPAGGLGTHLPPLSGHHHQHAKPPRMEEKAERAEEKLRAESHAAKIEAPNSDRNAIALNSTRPTEIATPEPTPTPTPEPVETPEPTAAPTQAPTLQPSAIPTHRPRPRPTPRPRPEARKLNKHLKPPRPNVKPSVMLALRSTPIPRAARTPSVKERLAMLRKQLMAEHLKELAMEHAKKPAEPDTGNDTDDNNGGDETPTAKTGEHPSGGGPVAASSVTSGHGYGVGPGSGGAGILSDPEFLLYYQKVQERIKDEWTFAGGRKDLTTTVNFAIGPDGKLTGLEIAQSSNNASFDQSVLRAIRRAAPFPPPPQRYRDQFAQGVQAVFELGELRS
jgi:TonB family protein